MGIQPQITQINADGKTSNPISAFHGAGTENSLSFQYLRSFALSAVMKFPGAYGQND